MRIIMLAAVICIVCESSLAHKKPLPRFEDYPVSFRFTGKPAQPKIISARARKYRTRISEGAQAAPNFAGHYPIVTWGCGSDCKGLAIVDARTGQVYTPPEVYAAIKMPSQLDDALRYRVDSKLLIVEGWRQHARSREMPSGKWYYKWNNNQLKLLRASKK